MLFKGAIQNLKWRNLVRQWISAICISQDNVEKNWNKLLDDNLIQNRGGNKANKEGNGKKVTPFFHGMNKLVKNK